MTRSITIPFIGKIATQPASLSRADVMTHKSRLILTADGCLGFHDRDAQCYAPSLYRGAAVWELWLADHAETPDADRGRCVLSALSLATHAGDWPLVREIEARPGFAAIPDPEGVRAWAAERRAFGEAVGDPLVPHDLIDEVLARLPAGVMGRDRAMFRAMLRAACLDATGPTGTVDEILAGLREGIYSLADTMRLCEQLTETLGKVRGKLAEIQGEKGDDHGR